MDALRDNNRNTSLLAESSRTAGETVRIKSDPTSGGIITVAQEAQKDAFGRLRTSEPTSIFDSQFQYNLQPLIWNQKTASNGTITHEPTKSGFTLDVDSTNGSLALMQTKRYMRYQPGKSQMILMTFVIGSSTPTFVRRTSVSGSVVDNEVTQSNWNLDKFDGTGVSGITLDVTKSQILIIDLEWLSVGRVRCGFVIDGNIYYAHEFRNANNLSVPYMRTANLPLRYRLYNDNGTILKHVGYGDDNDGIFLKTSETNTSGSYLGICSTVISEGGVQDDKGYTFSASNGITTIGVTTRRPILSIRPKATFNSIVNRGQIEQLSIALSAQTNSCFWELVYNGTLTGASFASVSNNSIVERDIASTAISGGEVVASGYGIAGSGVTRGETGENLLSRLFLTNDIDGANPDTLTLVCTSFSGTSNVTGEMAWKEIY